MLKHLKPNKRDYFFILIGFSIFVSVNWFISWIYFLIGDNTWVTYGQIFIITKTVEALVVMDMWSIVVIKYNKRKRKYELKSFELTGKIGHGMSTPLKIDESKKK